MTLKMEASRFSETSVTIFERIRLNAPRNVCLYVRHYVKLPMDETTNKETRNNETNGERGKEKTGKKENKTEKFYLEYEFNSDVGACHE